MAIGTTLRSARIQRGLSIEQVAQDTRISARFLEALEDEAFDELPAPVYARGFLRSYANYLKVDANPLLEELNSASPRPLTGPDSFVGGPGAQQRPQRGGGSNPFQRTPPPPPARPPQPEPVQAVEEDPGRPYEDEESDSWDPRDEEPADGPRRQLSGRYYENEPTVEPLPPGEDHFRPRRVAGVLLEREARPGEGQGGTRVLAIVGGAVIIILFALAAAVILTRNGDGGTNVAVPDATATPTSRPGTVIAVGSATAVTTASPSPSTSASPSGTPGTTTPTVANTPATATATPRPGTPTPTSTPETPTPTQAPATATPTQRPPTATPTIAVPLTGSGVSECTKKANGDTDCGPQPYRVVCFPGGWFIDVAPWITLPPLPGWTAVEVSNPSLGQVMNVGLGGC